MFKFKITICHVSIVVGSSKENMLDLSLYLFCPLRALNLQIFISILYSNIGILLHILMYYIEPQPIYSIVR